MVERSISDAVIREVILEGEVIKEYPDDKPYASRLLFKVVAKRPIHVVAAKDEQQRCIAITAYEPDAKIWKEDFKTKK